MLAAVTHLFSMATTVYERILALEWLDSDPFAFAAAAMSLDH